MKRMKRVFTLIALMVLAAMLLAGCKSNIPEVSDETANQGGDTGDTNVTQEAPESALSGSTEEILNQILSVNEDIVYFIDPVTSENAPSMLGMTPDDFVSMVEEATSAMNILGVIAFQATIVKVKDVNDVEMVAEMIQKGFDSSKWIETMPEQSLTVISGQYILLAVGTADETDTLASAFKNAAGGAASEPVVFYTGEFGANVDPEFGIEPLPADLGSEG